MMTLNDIHSKETLIEGLNGAHQAIRVYIDSLDEKSFVYTPDHRWSPMQQLQHLILSSKGIPSILKMSKFKLALVGKSKRDSRSYEKLLEDYRKILGTNVKAGPKFSPRPEESWNKNELLANWDLIGSKYKQRIGSWSEKDLDSYQVPHPAMGKLTIREVLMFTIFHARHHLEKMKELF